MKAIAAITRVLRSTKSLYHAYISLREDLNSRELKTPRKQKSLGITNNISRGLQYGLKSQMSPDTLSGPYNRLGQEIAEELEAARSEVNRRDEEKASLELEACNEAEAFAKGQIVECACCFVDTPTNRLCYCSAEQRHAFCFTCGKRNAETTLGQGSVKPRCMDQSGCEACFPEMELRKCLEKTIVDKLVRKQDQQEIRDANIEGLEECPFCDFMAVCESNTTNREFECQAAECGKISCRLCQQITHVPLNCGEAAEIAAHDDKIDARHVVEEAMTAALIRDCNKCTHRFIKEEGCNKMTCPRCGNYQCYVCRQSIDIGYGHFKKDGCPVSDAVNVDERHDAEVKKAEDEAVSKVSAERKDMSIEDLRMKFSIEAELAEEARKTKEGHGNGQRPHHGPVMRPDYDELVRQEMLRRQMQATVRRAPEVIIAAAMPQTDNRVQFKPNRSHQPFIPHELTPNSVFRPAMIAHDSRINLPMIYSRAPVIGAKGLPKVASDKIASRMAPRGIVHGGPQKGCQGFMAQDNVHYHNQNYGSFPVGRQPLETIAHTQYEQLQKTRVEPSVWPAGKAILSAADSSPQMQSQMPMRKTGLQHLMANRIDEEQQSFHLNLMKAIQRQKDEYFVFMKVINADLIPLPDVDQQWRQYRDLALKSIEEQLKLTNLKPLIGVQVQQKLQARLQEHLQSQRLLARQKLLDQSLWHNPIDKLSLKRDITQIGVQPISAKGTFASREVFPHMNDQLAYCEIPAADRTFPARSNQELGQYNDFADDALDNFNSGISGGARWNLGNTQFMHTDGTNNHPNISQAHTTGWPTLSSNAQLPNESLSPHDQQHTSLWFTGSTLYQ